MKLLASRIKELRKEKGLTQKNLANILGVAKSTVSCYEAELRAPDIDTIAKLAEIFQVTTDYLLGRSDFKGGRLVTNEELKTFLPEYMVDRHMHQWFVNDPPDSLAEETKEQIKEVLRKNGFLK